MSQVVALLNEFGGWLVHHLWRLSIELAMLAGVVLLAIRLLRVRSPRLRHLFWGLVLAKPVVTFLIASPISLYWFIRPPAPEPPPPAPVVEVRRPAATYQRPVMPMRPQRRPAPARTDLPPPPPWWSALEPRGIAASAWLVVVALLALRLVVGFAFVSFLRHTAAPLRAGPIRELVSRTATEMGLRRHVRVAASVTVHAPVLAGVLRPAILLPRQLIDSFSLEQLRYVIAHELAHVRRLDNGVLLVQRMAELLLFFHPVVWVCGWAMRREAEAACDDAVVAACGSPAQYADSLTRVAETTRSVRSLITRRLLVNTFAAAESNFASRVRRILRGRAGRMGIGLTVASVIALVLIACFGLPTAAEPEEETLSGSGGKETKEESVRGKQDSLRYGFRRDPMEWVGSDESLQAAMVRTFVFERPADGDAELLNARVEQILAGQAEDGRIGEKTVCAALELFRLGCPPGDPRLRRAVDWIALNATDEDGTLPTYALRAVCLSGQGHAELRDASLRKLAQQCERGMHAGCPWTPSVSLETLWAGRAFVDVEAALASELRWMAQGMNQAGFLSYKDPWGLLNVAGTVDHPLGREIVVKLLPMILRTQLHDGSWGGGSEVPEAPGGTFMVLRALVKYGLLDKLRDLPPLPADWRVVRSIPAPPVPEAGEPDWEFYRTMTFGRGLLWVYVPKIHSAIAVSPEDGQVVRTVKLPGEATYGIGWYRDSLAILTGPEDVGPLALVDPESGEVQREIAVDPDLARVCTVPAEVNGRLWCADGWFWIVHTVDPERPWQLQHICLAAPTGGWGTDMAFDGAGLWHFDRGEALLVRSDVRAEPLRWEGEPAEGLPFGAAHDGEPIGGFHSARLLDFAEKPFGNLGGVAWDGNHLWALDVDGRAICMIERAPGGSATAPMSHGSRAKLPSTTPGPRHGFRHDPMRFVEEGGTLEAALARKLVFGRRRAGDDEIISARLAEVLSEQRPDGSLGPTAKETGNGLYRLAALGLKADTAQVRRAFEAMIRQVRAGQIGGEGYEPEHRLVPVNGLRGACMAGCTDSPEVRRTLRWLADNPDIWTRQTCPWGATFVLRALWHGRDVEEVDAGLAAGLRIVAGNLNDAGCVKYWDPYAVVAAVGVIEWPEARSILLRQLPMVLRGQQGDGSWGDNPEDLPTLGVLRALKIHNLLDELRELPALPPDWEVVRSIPAPEGKLGTMAWLDGRLWVLDWEAGQIMALSPEDGGVARALPFPEGGAAGVGRWGDSLAVTQGKPHKRLLKVSPESGAAEREVPLSFMEMIMSATEVDGRLWVADGWLFPGNVVDPDDPSTYSGADAYELPRLEPHLAGTCPNGFAVAPDGVWHTDYFARVMIKSAPDGTLMDWAERPFGWTSGIAYDGRQLWAIDNANGRICAIEKTLTAPRVRSETALDRPAGEVKISPDREKLLDLAEHDHHPRDSFSLTMQAAARAFGKDVDYERLYALSTNAFAPDLRPDEQCRITWRMRGRGQCLDLVADALGLRVRPLHGPTDGTDPVPVVRDALERGEAVVTDGGWQHDFMLWGIVTNVRDDGTLVGVTPNGRTDNTFDHHCSFWALSPGDRELTGRQADLAMLRRAVARIRANEEPFTPDALVYGQPAVGRPARPGAVLWGLPAMDRWIEQMEQVPYQQDDPGSSVGNARLCAWHTLHGAQVAAGALRDVADRLDAARPQLRRAASSYDRMADLLRPAVSGEGGEGYEQIMGDLEKQKAHAEVLREVKAELAAAADEMEAALRAEGVKVASAFESGSRSAVAGERKSAANVRREGSKVWIDGVPDMKVGRLDEGAFLRGAALLLAQQGEEVTLDELSAVSGDAFHLCHGTKWELRTHHAVPTDLLMNAVEAYGYRGRWTEPHFFWQIDRLPRDRKEELAEQYLAEIRSQVDAGRPALVGGAYGQCVEWRAVAGYDAREELFCYVGGEEPYTWTPLWDDKARELGFWDAQARGPLREGFVGGWISNAAFLIGGRARRVTEGERAVAALQRAADLHYAEPLDAGRGVVYHFGARAYREWARDLGELDYPADVERPRPDVPEIYDMNVLLYQTRQIADGRAVAAAYCEKAAQLMPGAREHLLAAAAQYRQEAQLAREAFAPFLPGTSDAEREAWLSSPRQRDAGVAAIGGMLDHERRAIAEIAAGLRAEGVEVAASLQQDGGGREAAPAHGAGGSVLELRGDGWVQETFSLSVAAVARSFGREASYEEICARSGQAFAPAIDFVNDCKDLLQCQGWLGHLCPMEMAAASVGLEMEALPLPAYGGESQDAEAKRKHYEECARVIAEALERGDAVVTSGGWEFEEGPFVEPWWAGLVTEVREDGTVVGSHLDGGPGCELANINPGEVFALRPSAEEADLEEVYRRMLREAVMRIRSQGRYARGEYCVFGLDALDEWIRVMRECEGFCPICQQKNGTGWRAAVLNAQAVTDRCTVAASYLRRIAPAFDEGAAALERAAGHYDRIVDLLRSPLTGEGGDHYRDLVGDLTRQRAHADRVLMAARSELVAAADEMEAALRAEGVAFEPERSAFNGGGEMSETGGLDYSKLDLECDRLRQDSFSVSVQAAAGLLGRDVDYETVHVLSTNCFAPGIRPDEPCKESWVLQARARSIDLVARGVGLEWGYPPNTEELNDVPDAPDAPWGSPAMDAWLRQWHRKPMVPHVRRLIGEGKVIASQGEWKSVPENIGVSWCDWGIITGANDDGTIVGLSTDGQFGHPTDYIRDGHVLSAGEPRLAGREADLAVLERAVHRIRGDADPYRPDRNFVFGLQAMDEWIAQMEKPSFQPDRAPDSHESKENAYATAMTCYSGAEVAARWLRGGAGEFPEDSSAHLESAARRYDRILALLRPALTGEGGEHYREFIGDLEKQKAHADVLRQVKAELAAAAEDMTAALAAEGIAVPQRGTVPASAAVAPPEQVELAGRTYDLVWIAPEDLRSAKLKLTGTCALRSEQAEPPAIYRDHVDPLYNIHCELANVEDGPPEGEDWAEYWRRLAEGLSGKVECFALAAYCDGKLAGHLRFFPGHLAHLRFGPPEFADRADSRTLLVGAGAVDLVGARDGLDKELVRRVTSYAGKSGYARVRAVGWSNVRPYAMWGESLPVAAYEACGFERAGSFEAPTADALSDMLAGAHGPDVQRMVREAMAGGMSEDEANRLYAVELRLAADAGQSGKAEVERLRQWANIFGGNPEKLLAGAERYPEVRELLRLESSLEPVSEEARAIRAHMRGLEPAEWDYVEQLEDALAAIASGSTPAGRGDRVRERLEYVEKRRQALLHWLAGTPQDEAEEAENTDADAVRLTYSLLARPDGEKRRLVQMVTDKLGPDDVSREDLEGLEESDDLAPFAHRIDMHGYQLWSFDRNHELLLRSIAAGRALGEWHEPGGPLAWGDGNPDDEPKVRSMLSRLEAWLDGAADAGLGGAEDYDEKVWLARCLALYLRDHLANYYNWYVDETMTANVQRENGKTWIEGVEKLSWAEKSPLTYPEALAVVCHAIGMDGVSPEYLAGVSGLAFRIQVQKEGLKWAGWVPAAECGADTTERPLLALGLGVNWLGPHVGLPDEDALRAAIVDSIERGVPVLSSGPIATPDWGVVAGYAEGGQRLLCRSFFDKGDDYAETADLPSAIVAIVERRTPPSPRDSVLKSLQFACATWHAGTVGDATDQYLTGEAAYADWVADLRGEARFQALVRGYRERGVDEPLQAIARGNEGLYGNLAHARSMAARYLGGARDQFDERTAAHLDRAAELYGQVADMLHNHLASVPGHGDGLTQDVRAAQADVLQRAMELEGKAIAEIAAALAAEGVPIPAVGDLWESAQIADEGPDPTEENDGGGASPANVRREDGKTWIEGLERFPAWMTQPGGYVASSRYLGLDHSPAWLYGGSGFAFALNVHRVLCPSGPTAWQDQKCNRLAGNVGLDIEQLLAFSGDEQAAEKRAAHFKRARQAIDAGLPIVGWEMDIPDYYVVCGYDEEGNYLFRDFDDSIGRIHYSKLGDTGIGVHYLMVVRPGEPAEDEVTVREALEFALEVAAGQHGHGGEYATGLAGYDRWIAALADPETMLADEVAGHGLAYNAACWAECRRHAAAFLQEARDRLDRGDLEEDLAEAAEHYGQVAASLTKVSELFPMNPGQGEAMHERLHDASRRQKALATLRGARAAEVAGLRALSRVAVALGTDPESVQALEEALASTGEGLENDGGGAPPASLRREDGKVWIEGVPTLTWGESSDITFVGAMEAALAATEHPYTADQIMGYSGLAFRVRWTPDGATGGKGWCPSIAVGEFPEHQQAVASATGWRFDIVDEMADEGNPRMGRYADRIAAGIESGFPVVGYPDTSDLNVAVAYGYQGEGTERKFLWRTYWSGDSAKEVPAAQIGPWVMIPVEFGGAPDPRRRLLDTLAIAVHNWRREESQSLNGYRYAWGEVALKAWREDVRRAAEFTEEQRRGLFFVHWWNFEAWQDARTRAAAFLEDEADTLSPEGRDAVLRAAELYAKEGALLQSQIGKAEAFLGPWTGKDFEDWTPAVREQEQEILSETLRLEREAIGALEEALAAEGADMAT